MASTLTLDGVDELLDALIRLAPDLAAEADPLQAAIASRTAGELRAAYPVVTGRLRDSVAVQRLSSRETGRVATQVVVGAPYAGFVEYGTARTAPRPTFGRVTRQGRQDFARAMIDRVRDRGLVVTGEPSE